MGIDILKSSPLFAGIEEKDIDALLHCLSAVKRQYQKGSFVLVEGETPATIGLVLSGSVQVIQEDYWGNRFILAQVEPGDLYGEAFSCAGVSEIPVSVIAVKQAEIMQIDYNKIVTTCPSACAFHSKMIRNMLQILAQKNIMLTQKIRHITGKTTREKLLSYLSAQAVGAKKETFVIPFNRQQLAEYLSVDRSAMSKELCKMRDEGVLKFKKNEFTLFK